MDVISRYKPEAEFHTPELCYIIEIHNTSSDPECSIAQARVAPGVTTRFHKLHGTIERYVILEGQGKVEVAGTPPTTVQPRDVVYIPAGATQRITNTGETDLIFMAICSPRFEQQNYEDCYG